MALLKSYEHSNIVENLKYKLWNFVKVTNGIDCSRTLVCVCVGNHLLTLYVTYNLVIQHNLIYSVMQTKSGSLLDLILTNIVKIRQHIELKIK